MKKPTISRKDFLVTACQGLCGLALTAGTGSWLAGCATGRIPAFTAQAHQGRFSVPRSLLAEKPWQVVKVPGWEYQVLVVREGEENYHALLMKCSHQFYKLSPGSKGLHCNLHGSAFDLEGRVTHGPAAKPLTRVPLRVEAESLVLG